jgi:hypothetical protein
MVRKYFGFKMMIILMVISTNVFAQNPASDFDYSINQEGNGVIITNYKGSLQNVFIPREIQGFSVVSVGGFGSNVLITRVTIPEGITSISAYAFSQCKNLVEINLPQTLTTIEERAFWDCENLKGIVIPESVSIFGFSVFCNSGLTNIVLPQNIRSIPSWMFVNTPLEQIIIPEGVTHIGSGAFEDCRRLRIVSFPSTIQSIGECDLVGFTDGGIGGADGSDKGGVFKNCEMLTSIMIPDTVTQVEFIDHDGNYPNEYNFYNFWGCKNIPLRIQARLRNLGYSRSF